MCERLRYALEIHFIHDIRHRCFMYTIAGELIVESALLTRSRCTKQNALSFLLCHIYSTPSRRKIIQAISPAVVSLHLHFTVYCQSTNLQIKYLQSVLDKNFMRNINKFFFNKNYIFVQGVPKFPDIFLKKITLVGENK